MLLQSMSTKQTAAQPPSIQPTNVPLKLSSTISLKSLWILLGTLVASMLVSCSPGSGKDNKQAELEDRHVLMQTLSSIEGVYVGEVYRVAGGGIPFDIELNLFIVEEPAGINEDGEIKFRPALRARYRRLDLPADSDSDRTLLVRYYAESGEMAMSTPTTTPINQSLSVRSQYIEGQITGQLSDSRGVIGDFKVEKVRARGLN